MQIEAHNQKWYFEKCHVIGRHDKKKLVILSLVFFFVQGMKLIIFVNQSTHQNGVVWIKRYKIENHGNVRISSG
jgi:hypothetical protein